jgi:hypothetical protein
MTIVRLRSGCGRDPDHLAWMQLQAQQQLEAQALPPKARSASVLPKRIE